MSQREEERLKKLASSLSDEKRKDIAALLGNEMKRRGIDQQSGSRLGIKSGVKRSAMAGLGAAEDLSELYREVDNQMDERSRSRKKTLKKTIKRPAIRSEQLQVLSSSVGLAARLVIKKISGNTLLLGGIVIFGALKLGLSIGIIAGTKDALAFSSKGTTSTTVLEEIQLGIKEPSLPGVWSDVDKQILSELDARRVELEKRREELDHKEQQLASQSETLASRLAELRGLTAKLKEFRKQKDDLHEARLEQLATVYGSMAPNEAAPLVAKLDENIALALLERMPGKRMGQILSMMPSERAIELTKSLTDKQNIR